MKGILTKLSDNKNALRTSSVEGEFKKLPSVGESFLLYAEPIDELKDYRLVATSIVKSVKRDENVITLETLNSIYQLELMPEDS